MLVYEAVCAGGCPARRRQLASPVPGAAGKPGAGGRGKQHSWRRSGARQQAEAAAVAWRLGGGGGDGGGGAAGTYCCVYATLAQLYVGVQPLLLSYTSGSAPTARLPIWIVRPIWPAPDQIASIAVIALPGKGDFKKWEMLTRPLLTPPSPKKGPDLGPETRAGYSGFGLRGPNARPMDRSRRKTADGTLTPGVTPCVLELYILY